MEEAPPYWILCVYNIYIDIYNIYIYIYIYIYIQVYNCRCYRAYMGRLRIESKGSCFLFVASLINRIHLSQACSVSAAGLAADRATGQSLHQRHRKQMWICICDSANYCMLRLCTKVFIVGLCCCSLALNCVVAQAGNTPNHAACKHTVEACRKPTALSSS